jgi:hypothetical protein
LVDKNIKNTFLLFSCHSITLISKIRDVPFEIKNKKGHYLFPFSSKLQGATAEGGGLLTP